MTALLPEVAAKKLPREYEDDPLISKPSYRIRYQHLALHPTSHHHLLQNLKQNIALDTSDARCSLILAAMEGSSVHQGVATAGEDPELGLAVVLYQRDTVHQCQQLRSIVIEGYGF
jgi:hypothetical protein